MVKLCPVNKRNQLRCKNVFVIMVLLHHVFFHIILIFCAFIDSILTMDNKWFMFVGIRGYKVSAVPWIVRYCSGHFVKSFQFESMWPRARII